MASMARVDEKMSPGDGAARRRLRPDPRPLASFRVLAEVDHDRALTMLIEQEIIPRLMAAHASAPVVADSARASARRRRTGALPGAVTSAGAPAEVAPIEHGIDSDEVATLASLSLQVEADALLDHVDAILARGVSVVGVMVDLLAPTARLLGEYWEEDRCDFVEVTMALWRLHAVVHEIAGRAPDERRRAAGGLRALFASMPGDQHHFGTVLIDELFRRDGWITERMSDADTPDLLRRIGDGWYDLVGLTISCDCHIAPLASTIAAMRNVSRNPRLCVMVGGRVLGLDPDLARRAGADGTARDARLALDVAADLVRVRQGEALVAG